MAFRCPACQGKSLAITHSLELPPDADSDEITVQVIRCTACDFAAVAVYEESRRGASERWHHDGFRCPPATVQSITGLIQQCPAPSSRSCGCSTHLTLGTTQNGRWCGLEAVGVSRSRFFFMEWAE